MRPSMMAGVGVWEAGFRTIVLPAAAAAESFSTASCRGRLKAQMAAIGPIGKRRTRPRRPSPSGTWS